MHTIKFILFNKHGCFNTCIPILMLHLYHILVSIYHHFSPALLSLHFQWSSTLKTCSLTLQALSSATITLHWFLRHWSTVVLRLLKAIWNSSFQVWWWWWWIASRDLGLVSSALQLHLNTCKRVVLSVHSFGGVVGWYSNYAINIFQLNVWWNCPVVTTAFAKEPCM